MRYRKMLYPTIGKLAFTVYVLAAFFIVPGNALAHRVNVYAYAMDSMVYAEGYFSDGTKCQDAAIDVFDEKGNKLLTGKTGSDGKFSFRIPVGSALKIVLDAGAGHRNEYTLSAEEVKAALGDSAGHSGVNGQETGAGNEKTHTEVATSGVATGDDPRLEAVVNKVVDMKMRPLMDRLLKDEQKSQKPGFAEAASGIGYIAGVFGIVMWFKSRK